MPDGIVVPPGSPRGDVAAGIRFEVPSDDGGRSGSGGGNFGARHAVKVARRPCRRLVAYRAAVLGVGLLGPVVAFERDVAIDLGRPMHAALLGLLALQRGRVVTTAAAVDALWGEDPPDTAVGSLQAHVSRLRRALGSHGSAVETGRAGYTLGVEPDAVDANQFELLLANGRAAMLDGQWEQASELLGRALALWRGPALADVRAPYAAPAAARLENLRLVAEEDLLEVGLALGRDAEVVDRSDALVTAHPYRERLWRSRIVALYRGGQAAAALDAYQGLRSTLIDELGVDPSPPLQELELAILRHDPALLLVESSDREPDTDGALARREPRLEPVTVPPIRYATAADGTHVAYQVVGDGPIDVLVSQSYVWQCEVGWEHEPATRLWRALAERYRVLLYDKRGQGLSDRSRLDSLAQRALDVSAVLDAAGSDRAVALGNSDGSFVTGAAAAVDSRPVGYISVSGGLSMWTPDRPWAPDREAFLAWARWLSSRWGTGRSLRVLAPSLADDPATAAWMGRLERAACGPGEVEHLLYVQSDLDWTALARGLRLPALVIRRHNESVQAECCRELADVLDGRYVEVPGDEHLMYLGDHQPIVDHVDDFRLL